MKRGARKTRGQLSSFELLPVECDGVVAWASDALRDRDRLQTEIYEEFVTRLQAIQKEHRGELEFKIPSFSSFNRMSTRLATMMARADMTREITNAMSKKFDASSSDNLTIIAAEAIKTLIFELLTDAGESGIDPKGAMQLAAALRNASQAQTVSTSRRQLVQAEFAKDVDEAVEKVAKVKGLTTDTVEAIKSQILGV
jgi:hypothetical protein